jgi:hypothetical protein
MSLAELETSIPALVQSSSTDGTVPVLFRHTPAHNASGDCFRSTHGHGYRFENLPADYVLTGGYLILPNRCQKSWQIVEGLID